MSEKADRGRTNELMCVSLCVCVSERKREREKKNRGRERGKERKREKELHLPMNIFCKGSFSCQSPFKKVFENC